MEDISIEVGCSINTVSKALNNKPDISKETRQKVLDAAKKLGYIPNFLAKSLVTRSTGTIGIIVPNLTNPIHMEIVEAIAETAAEINYSTFLAFSSYSEETEAKTIESLYQKRVDGFIIIPASGQSASYERLLRFQTPVVYVLQDIESKDSCFVGLDIENCVYTAATHLVKAGCKKIALMVSLPAHASGFLQGYQKALKENALIYNSRDVYMPEKVSSTHVTSSQLVQQIKEYLHLYDGMVIDNDLLFVTLYPALKEKKITCPGDLRVAACMNSGFGNDWEIPVAVNEVNYVRMGMDALSLLLNMIKAENPITGQKAILPVRLRVRQPNGKFISGV
jgi:LacI family transcriptional regulator